MLPKGAAYTRVQDDFDIRVNDAQPSHDPYARFSIELFWRSGKRWKTARWVGILFRTLINGKCRSSHPFFVRPQIIAFLRALLSLHRVCVCVCVSTAHSTRGTPHSITHCSRCRPRINESKIILLLDSVPDTVKIRESHCYLSGRCLCTLYACILHQSIDSVNSIHTHIGMI